MPRQNQWKSSLLAPALWGKTSRLLCATLIVMSLIAGCSMNKATVSDVRYCDDREGTEYYRASANRIAYPCLDNQTPEAVATSDEPRNLRRKLEDSPREISLHEVMQTALSHNEVIETSALGGIGAKAVLTNPTNVASVYDPAIQASGVLFGRRSVESALADFDTTFSTALTWSRDDISPGGTLAGSGNRTTFTSELRKQFATGGSIRVGHDWTRTGDPSFPGGGAAGTAQPLKYFGRLGAEIRQPLLAGSGVDYTRIAGPANPNFGAITGVSQGVVIARINEDVSIANFEIAVRNALRDIEDAYWVLYFAYRTYDTAVVAHQSAYQTWWESNERLDAGLLKPADERQANAQLYKTKAGVELGLNNLFKAEAELRRLIGLPMNDGTVLRPSDEPTLSEIVPDWTACRRDALTNRIELRRQKWNIKSLQLQLQAARSLVRPRFDFIAGYDINGAGESLTSPNDGAFRNAYRSMGTQDMDSWNAGFQLSVPLGQRFSRSQVRNLELQIAKASAVLASQEKNIAHDIATAIQDMAATYAAAQTNYKYLKAAADQVELYKTERDVGTATLDRVLRAQAELATAENAYYEQVVDYNKAIMQLNFATGRLLENNGVYLAEGQWRPEAYCDALMRAQARTHAKDAPKLRTQPEEFVSPGPTGIVELYDTQVPVNPASPIPSSESSEAFEIQEAPAPPEEAEKRGADDVPPPVPAESESVKKQPRHRAAFVEPKEIFDPLKAYDKNPPRAASSRNDDFPSLDIFRR